MSYIRGLFNNPSPNRINAVSNIDSYFVNFLSNIVLVSLSLPRGIFPICLAVSQLLPLATFPNNFILLDVLSLSILGRLCKYEFLQVFPIPHSHPFWSQTFASGFYSQILSACVSSLMQETMFYTYIIELSLVFKYLRDMKINVFELNNNQEFFSTFTFYFL